MSASTTDVLTAIKNIVTALATEASNFLNVNGQLSACGIASPTVIKTSAGRVAVVSVIVGGSSGFIYDSAVIGNTKKPLYVLPMTQGVYVVNMPVSFGILVVPGAGQTVSVSFS